MVKQQSPTDTIKANQEAGYDNSVLNANAKPFVSQSNKEINIVDTESIDSGEPNPYVNMTKASESAAVSSIANVLASDGLDTSMNSNGD